MLRPIFSRRFVDDTVLLFRAKDHVEHFNKQHKNITFKSKIEENSSLSFLDITIVRENNKYVISVYCKPTFSGVFINFESFILEMRKCGLIETLLYRSFRLCSSYEHFHRKIEMLKSLFKHNNYPQNFVNQSLKKFLNKLFITKDINAMVPKRELTFILTYLGKLSIDFKTRLRRTIERDCKLKIIF